MLNMSPTRICLMTFVFCTLSLMIQAGTWLSFNQKAPNDLMPYSIIDKDLANFMQMCKEGINVPRAIPRQKQNFAEICAALSDLTVGR
uniref:Uncharacterized protein n=2 Tax=Onchocerca volvulus TaxID=6282 RepID=A0A8R1TIK2_ONCVO